MSGNEPRVEKNLRCIRCGHNLLGQRENGMCPGCKLAVSCSQPAAMIAESDPDWVTSIRSGLNWLVIGIVAYIAFLIYIAIRALNWLESLGDDFNNIAIAQAPTSQLVIDAVLQLILINILCIATWKMTRPEPFVTYTSPARDIARYVLLSAYFLAMVASLVHIPQSEGLAPLELLLTALSFVFDIIGTLAMLAYLRELARRIPDKSLARQTVIIQILIVCVIMLLVIPLLAMLSGGHVSIEQMDQLFVLIVLAAVALFMVGISIWWIILTLRFRSHFVRLATVAFYYHHNKRAVRYEMPADQPRMESDANPHRPVQYHEAHIDSEINMQEDNEDRPDDSASPEYAESPEQPAEQPIDFDLNCVRCGYNLRSTFAGGNCPECGEPVETTLRPDLLHMAELGWLDRLRKGMNWLIWAIIIILIMIPVLMVFGIASAAAANNPSTNFDIILNIVSGVFGITFSILYIVGIWFLTTPEPNTFRKPNSCATTRWTILIGMVLSIIAQPFHLSWQTEAIGSCFDFFGSVLTIIGFFTCLWYLKLLANRIPEPSLARQTTIVFWGNLGMIAGTILLAIIAGIISASVANTNSPNAMASVASFMMLLFCPLVIAMLVFGIWWIVLMFLYRTRFTQAYGFAMSRSSTAHPGAY